MEGGASDEQTILAALAMLLDRAHLRVGKQAYIEQNVTYGATTLLKRYLGLRGEWLELSFTRKDGKRIRRSFRRLKLSRVPAQTSDLPGRHLFRDANDQLRPIDSSHP